MQGLDPSPGPAIQLQLVTAVLDKEDFLPTPGRTYNVLSAAWWQAFAAWAQANGLTTDASGVNVALQPPGRINNTGLAEEGSLLALRRPLTEDVDYKLVPNEAFELLRKWHGLADGSPAFPREVLTASDGSTRVELWPTLCTITATSTPSASTQRLLSRSATPAAVYSALAADAALLAGFGIPSTPYTRSNLRVWFRVDSSDAEQVSDYALDVGGSKWELLASPAVSDLGALARNSTSAALKIEVRAADGNWPFAGLLYPPGFGPDASAVADVAAWRGRLGTGATADVLDKAGTWQRAVVVSVKADPNGSANGLLEFRFTQWAPAFNETLPRSSERILPLLSKVPPFDLALRVGDAVGVKNSRVLGDETRPALVDASEKELLKFYGVVTEVDHAVVPPLITVAHVAPPTAETQGSESGAVIFVKDTLGAAYRLHPRVPEQVARPTNVPPAPTVPSFLKAWSSPLPPLMPPVAGTSSTALVVSSSGGGSSSSSSGTAATVRRSERLNGHSSLPDDVGDLVTYEAQVRVANHYRTRISGLASNARSARSASGTAGITGLSNIGNTCFMNSMLQCLSNTWELTQYYLSNAYIRDINTTSTFGTKGKLAHAWAALLHIMWSGAVGSVSPTDVKAIIAQRAPAFLGWDQHDSQEFASFFLDTLLEDQCRVPVKPSVPTVESNGRPDPVVAAEAWDAYLKRNDSKIVDIFGGQYRSHVQCNQCGNESITFDPFTSFAAPIPLEKFIPQPVFYFDGLNPPTRFAIWRSQRDEPLTGGQVAAWVRERLLEQAAAAAAGKNFDLDVPYASGQPDVVRPVKLDRYAPSKAPDFRRSAAWAFDGASASSSTASTGGLGLVSSLSDIDDTEPEPAPAPTPAPAEAATGAAPDTFRGVRIPAVEEMLVMWGSGINNTSMPQMEVPHWMPLDMAEVRAAKELSETYRTTVAPSFLMVAFVPGAGAGNVPDVFAPAVAPEAYQEQVNAAVVAVNARVAALESAAAEGGGASTPGGSMLAPGEGPASLTFPSVPDTDLPARPETEEAAAAYESGLRSGSGGGGGSDDDDDDDAGGGYGGGWSTYMPRNNHAAIAAKRAAAAAKATARAAAVYKASGTSAGPAPGEYVKVWLRKAGVAQKYTVFSDFLAVPAVTRVPRGGDVLAPSLDPAAAAAVAAEPLRRVALREFRALLDARLERFFGGDVAKARRAYKLYRFSYNYNLRNKLAVDYREHGIPEKGLLPAEGPLLDTELLGVGPATVYVADFLANAGEAFTNAVRNHVSYYCEAQKAAITLDKCVRRFQEREQLGEDDKWYCNKCKTHVRAFKKVGFWKLPPVFIVQLKRFQYERGFYSGRVMGKVNDLVTFPTVGLDMSPFLLGPDGEGAVYDLYAVSDHHGGMGGGHYTAHAKNPIDGRWYNFDDSYVSPASEASAVSASAYVLFYRRRQPGAAAPGSPFPAGISPAVPRSTGLPVPLPSEEGAGAAAAPGGSGDDDADEPMGGSNNNAGATVHGDLEAADDLYRLTRQTAMEDDDAGGGYRSGYRGGYLPVPEDQRAADEDIDSI